MARKGNKRVTSASASASGSESGSASSSDTNVFEETAKRVLTESLLSKDFIDLIVKAVIERLPEGVLKEVENSAKYSCEKCNDLETKLEAQDQKIAELRAELEDKNEQLEQYTRRNSLRVFGVPESIGESTDELILQVAQSVNVHIDPKEIDRSHRVGQAFPGKPRPIIVKFTSFRARQELFTKKRLLKGRPITIREDLTASRLAVLRAAVSRFGIKNVWTESGTVIVKTPDGTKHRITRVNQLLN